MVKEKLQRVAAKNHTASELPAINVLNPLSTPSISKPPLSFVFMFLRLTNVEVVSPLPSYCEASMKQHV